MRYKKRNGAIMWIIAGVCVAVIIGAGVLFGIRAMAPASGKNVEVIGSNDNTALQGDVLTKEYTYGNLTFKVGSDWTEIDDERADVTFVHSDGYTQYSLLALYDDTMSSDVEEYFKKLLSELMDSGKTLDPKGLKPIVPYTMADGRDAYVGRITVTKDDLAYAETDVLLIPDIKYMIAIVGVYTKNRKLPMDVRDITDTVTINKETGAVTKTTVEGGVTSKTVNVNSCFYDANTGSLLDMTDTENFKIYVFADNKDGLYSGGTYEVYMGDDAVDKVDEMTFYGITREEVELMINRAQEGYALATGLSYQNPGDKLYSVDRNDFCAMVFNIEYIHDDSGNITENKKQPVLYVGFYVEELDMFDMTNCMTFSTYRWERQK